MYLKAQVHTGFHKDYVFSYISERFTGHLQNNQLNFYADFTWFTQSAFPLHIRLKFTKTLHRFKENVIVNFTSVKV